MGGDGRCGEDGQGEEEGAQQKNKREVCNLIGDAAISLGLHMHGRRMLQMTEVRLESFRGGGSFPGHTSGPQAGDGVGWLDCLLLFPFFAVLERTAGAGSFWRPTSCERANGTSASGLDDYRTGVAGLEWRRTTQNHNTRDTALYGPATKKKRNKGKEEFFRLFAKTCTRQAESCCCCCRFTCPFSGPRPPGPPPVACPAGTSTCHSSQSKAPSFP